jgi:hypothetical protein
MLQQEKKRAPSGVKNITPYDAGGRESRGGSFFARACSSLADRLLFLTESRETRRVPADHRGGDFMDVSTLRLFFFWCALLNYLALGAMAAVFVFAGDRIFALHRRWFALDRDVFDVAMYFFLGFYKLFVFVFCLVPWIALLIAG